MKIKEKLKATFHMCNLFRQKIIEHQVEHSEIIRENIQFKNIHKGQRCFIVGNGPSLKDQDLSLLADEWVFTVNRASAAPWFPAVKAQYHFLADPIFWSMEANDPLQNDWLNSIKQLSAFGNAPKVFWSARSYQTVQDNNLSQYFESHYFLGVGNLFYGRNLRKPIDYCRTVPGLGSVVQYCVTMAIYMGFTEIYLLGCDCTGVINSIEAAKGERLTEYTYDMTEQGKAHYSALISHHGMTIIFKNWAGIFESYEQLRIYCDMHSIKLINATSGGALDSLPRVKYEDLFREQKE